MNFGDKLRRQADAFHDAKREREAKQAEEDRRLGAQQLDHLLPAFDLVSLEGSRQYLVKPSMAGARYSQSFIQGFTDRAAEIGLRVLRPREGGLLVLWGPEEDR